MLENVLNYPFDIHAIQQKKKKIKKLFLGRPANANCRIAILGGSTTAEIRDVLELFLLKEGINPVFYESDFNKYYEDIIFDNVTLQSFKPDVIYIHTTAANIEDYPQITDGKDEANHKFEKELNKFKSLWGKIKQIYNCLIIQNNFELPYHRSLGNLDFSDFHGRTHFTMKLNYAFAQYAEENTGFFINDINYLSSWFGLERWYDRQFWFSYKYALSYDAIPFLSHNIANIIKAIYGKSKKCLVLDLDNTLWGGVIGDDGINNIQIGKGNATSEGFYAFQEYVKELKARGIILAVCSKNDLENAKEGLSHPESALSFSDFASFKANWNHKHCNITEIVSELNIGADSIVFVDDNPSERELVKSQLPHVAVPDITSDVLKYIEYLDKGGYFEPALLSHDDINRTTYYEQKSRVMNLHSNYSNYDEFLVHLKMKAGIECFSPFYLGRITQLINKTNQFNLTTRRYTLGEVENISRRDNYIHLYGRLSDRFGDHGLVSVVIGSIHEDVLHLDLWLMSCRVLKRNFELAMFDELVTRCCRKGIGIIRGYYYKTQKNQMVAHFYEMLGFTVVSSHESGDSTWMYVIPDHYNQRNEFIEVSNDKR